MRGEYYLDVVTIGAQGAVDVPPAVLQDLVTPLAVLLTRGINAAIVLVLASEDLHHNSRGRGAIHQEYEQKHEMLQHDACDAKDWFDAPFLSSYLRDSLLHCRPADCCMYIALVGTGLQLIAATPPVHPSNHTCPVS